MQNKHIFRVLQINNFYVLFFLLAIRVDKKAFLLHKYPIKMFCTDSGIFPSFLKLVLIRPILKSGDSINATNYRPMIIPPHLSKLFKTLVVNSVRFSLNHILVDQKHGFYPDGSNVLYNLILH